MTTYSGFTETTAEKLLLDAGAFFKNFEVETDTFETAVTSGKLLGATQGGGSFSAIPTIRKIEVDGVKGAAKGLEVIDEWVVNITANMKEISEDVLVTALATGEAAVGSAGYNKITAGNSIELNDYIDNITWVGRLSGSEEPVVIQVLNALSTGGLTVTTTDKAEAVVALTFTGHYDTTDLDSPPFEIHYPTSAETKGSISGVISNAGGVVSGATVAVTVGSLAITATTNASGEYTLANVLAGTYTVSAYKAAEVGAETGVVVVAGANTTDTDITIA